MRTTLATLTLLLSLPGPLASAKVPEMIYWFDASKATPSERVLVASIAGIVAKTTPELYTGRGLWLESLRRQRPDLDLQVERDTSVAPIIERYKEHLRGYVLYDGASINVANSVAGILRLAMVDASTVALVEASGLDRKLDVRGRNTAWVVRNYGRRFNRDYLFHQFPDRRYHLRDFAILKNGLVIFEEPERDEYFAAQNDHTRVFGWASSERDFFLRSSLHNLQGVAADWLRGAAATSRWDLPLLKQRTHVDPETLDSEAAVHYVAFVMSDGDNVQWLTNDFCEKKWYGSPHRGKFDMTWDMTPSLAEINPVAFNHLYSAASAGKHRDFFVNAGGPGLIYPSHYADIHGFVRTNSTAMRRADHNIVSILEDRWDPAKVDAILADPQVIGAMLKIGNAYRGHRGRVHWSRGKPCVAVRYTLWEGFDTPESIARDVGRAARDPGGSSESYSVVNVHPWSGDPMARVLRTIERFPPHVRVVTLEELILRLRGNLGER